MRMFLKITFSVTSFRGLQTDIKTFCKIEKKNLEIFQEGLLTPGSAPYSRCKNVFKHIFLFHDFRNGYRLILERFVK